MSGLIAAFLLCTLVGCPTDDPVVSEATDVNSPAPDLPDEDVVEPKDLLQDAAPEVDEEDTQPEPDSAPADGTADGTSDDGTSDGTSDDGISDGISDGTTEDAAVEDLGPQGPPDICIGISPPKSAFDPIEEPPTEADASGAQEDAANSDAGEMLPDPVPVIGEPWPNWSLYDFQPQSCGYTGTYGLDVYTGHVTVVVLLAAW
ncbi:MAG TPA: hypothetical protein EYN06_04700 [Myxococcales bacterium]|nr:hypothetical protein [Myxococcales bacterium]